MGAQILRPVYPINLHLDTHIYSRNCRGRICDVIVRDYIVWPVTSSQNLHEVPLLVTRCWLETRAREREWVCVYVFMIERKRATQTIKVSIPAHTDRLNAMNYVVLKHSAILTRLGFQNVLDVLFLSTQKHTAGVEFNDFFFVPALQRLLKPWKNICICA